MSDIGTERVEPSVRIPDRREPKPRREPRSRPRQPKAPEAIDSDAADNREGSLHQVDSMA